MICTRDFIGEARGRCKTLRQMDPEHETKVTRGWEKHKTEWESNVSQHHSEDSSGRLGNIVQEREAGRCFRREQARSYRVKKGGIGPGGGGRPGEGAHPECWNICFPCSEPWGPRWAAVGAPLGIWVLSLSFVSSSSLRSSSATELDVKPMCFIVSLGRIITIY